MQFGKGHDLGLFTPRISSQSNKPFWRYRHWNLAEKNDRKKRNIRIVRAPMSLQIVRALRVLFLKNTARPRLVRALN